MAADPEWLLELEALAERMEARSRSMGLLPAKPAPAPHLRLVAEPQAEGPLYGMPLLRQVVGQLEHGKAARERQRGLHPLRLVTDDDAA